MGHTCINYGINESRCLECPGEEDPNNPVEQEAFLGEDYEGGDGDGEKGGVKTKTEEKPVEKAD